MIEEKTHSPFPERTEVISSLPAKEVTLCKSPFIDEGPYLRRNLILTTEYSAMKGPPLFNIHRYIIPYYIIHFEELSH